MVKSVGCRLDGHGIESQPSHILSKSAQVGAVVQCYQWISYRKYYFINVLALYIQ